MGSSGSKSKQKTNKQEQNNDFTIDHGSSMQNKNVKITSSKQTLYKLAQPSPDDFGNDNEYSDPDDPSKMSLEGIVKFFQDIGVDGESIDSLYLLYLMETEELDSIKMSEYHQLLQKAGVETAKDARKYVKVEVDKVNNSDDHLK